MALHPVLFGMARRNATLAAMDKGLSRRDARRKVNAVKDSDINALAQAKCQELGLVMPSEVTEGLSKIGDGTIIQAVKDFFTAHPELLKLIIAGIMALIGL